MLKHENIHYYLRLMRVDRPIGTYLVAWPMLWALWLAADGWPGLKLIIVFLLGAFLMRSAGCVINDYADRNFDGHVERTKERPLATAAVSSSEAKTLFFVLCLLAACLLVFTNQKTIMLAFVGLALAICYPFMKRYTHLPQVVLGMAFSWAIPMAYAASTNTLPVDCWLLFIAATAWVVAYDTYYAMVDRDDDLKIGVKSTAILFGRYDRLAIALLQTLFMVLMVVIGIMAERQLLYFAGLALAGGLFVYQHRLTANKGREQCFKAFLNNHYTGMSVFIGLAADYLLQLAT